MQNNYSEFIFNVHKIVQVQMVNSENRFWTCLDTLERIKPASSSSGNRRNQM